MIIRKDYNKKDKALIKQVIFLMNNIIEFKDRNVYDTRREYGKEQLEKYLGDINNSYENILGYEKNSSGNYVYAFPSFVKNSFKKAISNLEKSIQLENDEIGNSFDKIGSRALAKSRQKR